MKNDWDIRLQCTVCGSRQRRYRRDGNPPYGQTPRATDTVVCSNCTANAGHKDDVKTVHFIDFASPRELAAT